MAALLDMLLNEPVDNDSSLLACVCVCCGPPSLLALTRCSTRLQQAVAAPLLQAERASAAKVSDHLGATLEEMAAGDIVTLRSGLPLAQCRHLGAWLQPGGPLEGVATLHMPVEYEGDEDEDDEDEDDENQYRIIDLTPLRSGASRPRYTSIV